MYLKLLQYVNYISIKIKTKQNDHLKILEIDQRHIINERFIQVHLLNLSKKSRILWHYSQRLLLFLATSHLTSCLKILPKPQQMERLWELAVLPPCYRGLILWKNSCLGTVGNNSYLTGKQSGKANIMSCLRSWQVGTSITWQTSQIFNKEIQGRKQPNRAWLRAPFSLVVWKAVYILQRSDRMSYLLPVLRWFSLSNSPCV